MFKFASMFAMIYFPFAIPPRKRFNIMIGGGKSKDKANNGVSNNIDNQLKAQGLKAIHNYRFNHGDCFFDCLQWLTGYASLNIRVLAIMQMQHEVANTNDDKALNNMLNINALAASKGGNMTPQLYIEGMKKSATKGGLWADIPIVIWAARALKIRIQIYRMEKGILHNAQIYGPAVDPSTGEPTKCIQLLFTGPLERGHYTPITGTDCEGPVQLLPPAILAATMSDQQLKLERASSYEVPHTNTIARVIRRLAKEAFYLEQPSTTKLVQNIQMIFPQTQHMTRELQEIANSVLSQQRRSYLLAPLADAVGLIWPTAKSWQQTTTISEEATDEGGPWQIATRRRRSSGQAQAPLPQRPPNQTPTASEPPAPAPPPRGAAAPDTSGSAHPTSSSPEDKGTDEVITAPGKNINALAALKPPPNKTH
jgi:hypothetical protein